MKLGVSEAYHTTVIPDLIGNPYNLKTKNQQGQILLLAIIVVALVLVNTLVIIGGSQLYFQNTTYAVASTQALNLAEAGVDKALAALNNTAGSYSEEQETQLGSGSFSVSITTPNPGTKIIEATGYIPSKLNPKSKRTVKATASKGVGIAFNYGVQVGEGGLEMSNDSVVNGSVYSNGNISMSNNARINGDVYVAGGIAPSADQQSDCTSSCGDFVFGTNVGGNDQLDVAQSFQPSSNNYLTKVSFKLRKVGSPADITVRIMKDKTGEPDKNNVLTSGTLTANLVTSSYPDADNFIEVTFNSSPYLTANTPYWIMLDTSANSSNYWNWSTDSLQGYTRGQAKWSSNWQAGNPVWVSIPRDLGFKTYMGGVATFIQGSPNVTIGGNAHANTLRDLTITQGAYYQVSQNITAGSYYPGSADPSPQVMPISEANIQAWKDDADDNIYTGNITACPSTLGPGKYVGNVTLSNNCTVTIKDPVWITGDMVLSNSVIFKLDPSYGSTSGVVIVDGRVRLSNTSKLEGSGQAGSFLMALSTYDSRVSGTPAIEVGNGGNEGILYAPYGIVEIENTNHLSELTAWKIELENNVIVDYDSGLAGAFFTAGPSGAYSLVKGQYQIK